MLNYLFYDHETGENFYVQEKSEQSAWSLLMREYEGNLDEVEFTGEVHSDYVAEQFGLDTY